MTDLITEARELCEKWSLSDYAVFECEDCIANMVIYKVVELCDALENTEKQLQEQFDKTGAWLEEYNEMKIALEKAEAQIKSIHQSLDFAETQRQKCKNYTELAINNGLALGRIAGTIQHDFGPLPTPPKKEGE